MALPKNILYDIAEKLAVAKNQRAPIENLSKLESGISIEDAYQIQMIQCGRALRDGKKLIGYKVGLTSSEAQKQFQVFEPDFGHLFNDMCLLSDAEMDITSLIQPKVEGEIAFVLGKDLRGPGVTLVDVMGAIDFVTACMEIVDSRIQNWKITAVDTIADNGSSSHFVLSPKKTLLQNIDLSQLGMALLQNAEVMVTGAGSACLGNPLNAVVFLANALSHHDRPLLAGEVILSGSLGPMIPLKPMSSYSCEIWKLGKVSLRTGALQEGL